MRRATAILAVAISIAGTSGCDDLAERALHDDVVLAAEREDALAERAVARLAAAGARAIPEIETALHTARPTGRLNLVAALRRGGAAESVPLLRHLAVYDDDVAVRAEALFTLRGFVQGEGPRAAAARAALRRVEELRRIEEGA
jgi:hypothetical protein